MSQSFEYFVDAKDYTLDANVVVIDRKMKKYKFCSSSIVNPKDIYTLGEEVTIVVKKKGIIPHQSHFFIVGTGKPSDCSNAIKFRPLPTSLIRFLEKKGIVEARQPSSKRFKASPKNIDTPKRLEKSVPANAEESSRPDDSSSINVVQGTDPHQDSSIGGSINESSNVVPMDLESLVPANAEESSRPDDSSSIPEVRVTDPQKESSSATSINESSNVVPMDLESVVPTNAEDYQQPTDSSVLAKVRVSLLHAYLIKKAMRQIGMQDSLNAFIGTLDNDSVWLIASILSFHDQLKGRLISINEPGIPKWTFSEFEISKYAGKHTFQVFDARGLRSDFFFKSFISKHKEGEKSYNCAFKSCFCKKTFKGNSYIDLARHLSRLYYLWLCNDCGNTYSMKSSLTTHFKECNSAAVTRASKRASIPLPTISLTDIEKRKAKGYKCVNSTLDQITYSKFSDEVDSVSDSFVGRSTAMSYSFSMFITALCCEITATLSNQETVTFIPKLHAGCRPFYMFDNDKKFVIWSLASRSPISLLEYRKSTKCIGREEKRGNFVCRYESCQKCDGNDLFKDDIYAAVEYHIRTENFRIGCVMCRQSFISLDSCKKHFTSECRADFITSRIIKNRKETIKTFNY